MQETQEVCPSFASDGKRLLFGRAAVDGNGPADGALIVVSVADDGMVEPLSTLPLGLDVMPVRSLGA